MSSEAVPDPYLGQPLDGIIASKWQLTDYGHCREGGGEEASRYHQVIISGDMLDDEHPNDQSYSNED